MLKEIRDHLILVAVMLVVFGGCVLLFVGAHKLSHG